MSYLVILIVLFLAPQTVFAYLDPGSGSYLVQIIVAALVGGVVTAKMFFTRIRLFFATLFNGKSKDIPTTNDDENA